MFAGSRPHAHSNPGGGSCAGGAGTVVAWHPAWVERWIDLDRVAVLICRHAVGWEQAGLVVGALTWRDVGVPWPYPLRTDRREVADADSVGVEVRRQEQEGRLVVFRGGWADLEYWTGQRCDEPVLEAPGARDPLALSDIERLLERFAGLFR
jgi:hypothetical protein